MPDLTNYLILITKEKSIRKKFNNAKLIFESMNKLGKFSGEKEFGMHIAAAYHELIRIQNDFLNPILNYLL